MVKNLWKMVWHSLTFSPRQLIFLKFPLLGVNVDKKGINVNGVPLDKALEDFVLKNLFGKKTEEVDDDDDDEDAEGDSDEKNCDDGAYLLIRSLTHLLTYLVQTKMTTSMS